MIVESPSLGDIDTGIRDGEHLHKLLAMVPIGEHAPGRAVESVYRPFSTHERLMAILEHEAKAASCLHVCGHGNSEGFGFTDKSVLRWDIFARVVLACAHQRIVVLAACNSDALRPLVGGLAQVLTAAVGRWPMPRCVLTFFGRVTFADSLLAWGLFYRHLFAALGKSKTQIADCSARVIFNALKSIKDSGLDVKICAAYWYDAQKKFVNISPWARPHGPADLDVVAIEKGLPVPDMVL